MNRLRFLRNEKSESLEVIAKYLNVTIQTISNYENEKRDMTPDTILKLADYFNVSTDYLLGKSDVRNPEEIDNSKLNVAFSSGYNGLNETNQNIINATIAGLLAKQKEEEKKDKNNNENKKESEKN